jgi:catechol 2,3-dioxygenase-like lactoylglutathione lyase family enzyme
VVRGGVLNKSPKLTAAPPSSLPRSTRIVRGRQLGSVVSGQGGSGFREARRLRHRATMKLSVNLLVLRCKDIEVTRRFYEQLGLAFVEEKHGSGPQHFVWESSGFVLELYPMRDGQSPDNVRIGLSTPLLADLAGDLRHNTDVNIVKQPYTTADRIVMLLQDPDGRKVEVSQPLHR